MKKFILPIIFIFFSASLYASTAVIENAKIQRTLLDSEAFGNCMAELSKDINTTGLNCPGRWVSFSCDGTYQARDIAKSMFDSAQMAMALNKKVFVYVDDLKKHNDNCVAYRIDVLRK